MGERRIPKQHRSQVRYDTIVDAAAALIDRDGPQGLTAAAIIDQAETSTGSFYAYFDDADAVVDALVERYLHGFVETLRSAFAVQRFDDIDAATDAIVDAFADYYRHQPGYRAIWHGGILRSHHHAADRANDLELVAVSAELLLEHGLVSAITDRLLDHLRINWRIGDVLLIDAFATDPNGDPTTIAEAKRTIRLRNRPAPVAGASANG